VVDGAAIKKYFAPFPKWAVWMIVLGVPLLFAKGLGILFIALGVYGLVRYFQKASDAQVDAWIEESLKKLQTQALNKIGTDPTDLVNPDGGAVVITGLVGDVAWPQGTFIGYRTGKDKVFRFSPLDVTIVNFTRDQLLVYQCALDLTTGNALSEKTDEYFYRDVVSVSTVTESANVRVSAKKVVQAKAAETFKLTTSGGTSVKVTLSDPEVLKEVGGGGTIPKTRSDKAIQTVRKMLREKKASPVSA
jgi:hypothetical protein